jgi:2-amino-4-hydroxy-6-hydroxymethyldihydropteridine diphosphokinase
VTRAFLGLGSNLGDRLAHLRAAVASLPDVVAVSDVYETEPVGGPEQGPYLNCVAELDTDLSPRALLAAAQAAERAADRVRTVRWGPRTLDVDVLLEVRTVRWGPRTLDVDVLLVDDLTVDEPELVVPHPRMFERSFVLIPLSDLAPELVPGGRPDDPGVRHFSAW